MRKYDTVGIAAPDVLLPREGVDLTKWAVVACDQYTSQPEYWQQVKELVGDAPSTLNLIYPEVFLGEEKACKLLSGSVYRSYEKCHRTFSSTRIFNTSL